MKKYLLTAVIIIIAAAAVSFFALMRKTDEKAAQNPGANSNAAQTAQNVISTSTDFYTITADYPTEPLDKDGVMKQFVEQQVQQKEDEWKTGGTAYNEEKNLERQFPDRPKMVYTLNINYQKFQSEKLGTVSYLFNIGTYTGGANGDEKVQAFTFDNNGPVDIQSILNLAGYGKAPAGSGVSSSTTMSNDLAITYLLSEQAQTNKEQFPDASITSQGLGLAYLKSDGVTLDHGKCGCDGFLFASNLQNFVPSDSGISFYFDKCSVTICASGTPSITLDWKTLKPYLENQRLTGE